MTHDPETKAEEMAQKCMDSQGYLLFSARLTQRRDAQDRPIIEYDYRRFHFTLEDAKQSLKALRKHIDEEIEALAASDEGGTD